MRLTAPAVLVTLLLLTLPEAQAARSCRFTLSGFTVMTKQPGARDITSDQNGNNDEIQTFIQDNGDKSTFYLYNVDTKTRYTYHLHDSPMHFAMTPVRMRYDNLFFVEETEYIRTSHRVRIVNAQTGRLQTMNVPRNVIRLLGSFGIGDNLLVLEFSLATGQRYRQAIRLN